MVSSNASSRSREGFGRPSDREDIVYRDRGQLGLIYGAFTREEPSPAPDVVCGIFRVQERDQFEVRSVIEGYQGVTRQPVGMLAAWGHCETETFVVGGGQVQVADEYHQMVQPGQHNKPIRNCQTSDAKSFLSTRETVAVQDTGRVSYIRHASTVKGPSWSHDTGVDPSRRPMVPAHCSDGESLP